MPLITIVTFSDFLLREQLFSNVSCLYGINISYYFMSEAIKQANRKREDIDSYIKKRQNILHLLRQRLMLSLLPVVCVGVHVVVVADAGVFG